MGRGSSTPKELRSQEKKILLIEENPKDIRRISEWLHQPGENMNNYVAEKVLGRRATREEAPLVLDEYGNTASAGSIIAFHKYNADLKVGDIGVICSFGAGYSAGSVVVQKVVNA